MLHLPWDLLLQLIRLIWKDCVITIIIILKNDKTMIIMKKSNYAGSTVLYNFICVNLCHLECMKTRQWASKNI